MSVNAAFVQAIATIKTLTRSPNTLGKPPQESKTTLYGLYKQATEGDVQGIMERPWGNSPQDKANQRKWDAWKQQQGQSKDEAKLRYIEYLLETMRMVSPDTPQSRGLVNELEALYITARDGSVPEPSHSRTPSYSQFLRRPTYSEFGLSVAGDTESVAEPMDYQNLTYQLDTISEEISSMRRGAGPPPSPPPPPASLVLLKLVLKLLNRFAQRVAVDVCGLTLFLILVKLMRRNRLPNGVQRVFATVGKVIAVVLREVGFDISVRQ